ncbi:MAG: lysine-sensitive aspartokinase 3 [Candidatus Cloacimonetes bacterium]|nr:lysine-sensitive aspartokinase 3 [Candidatus Cloacimonadota bacterium]
MKNYIVCKFGGTSVGDAECITRCADIVLSDPLHKVVLVSATSGTTNDLVQICQDFSQSVAIVTKLKEKHYQIASDLSCSRDVFYAIDTLINELHTLALGISYLHDCSSRTKDRILSIGERLSSLLLSYVIQQRDRLCKNFDIRNVMMTDSNHCSAKPQIDEIKNKVNDLMYPLLNEDYIIVSQGFIGSNAKGVTTTLGRGGSDLSAALMAQALQAKELKIYTDVAGMKTTDPRIVENVLSINELSFDEAAELATFGAKILHPSTLIPAIQCDIPVYLASSFEPDTLGTYIKSHVDQKPIVRAIALKQDQYLLTIKNPRMLEACGFLASVFEVFSNFKISVDLITTSEISIAVSIDKDIKENEEFIKELAKFGQIDFEENLSIIALVGNNITHTKGIAQKLFLNLTNHNIRMLCMGASSHNVCFLVDSSNSKEVVKILHKEFLEEAEQ